MTFQLQSHCKECRKPITTDCYVANWVGMTVQFDTRECMNAYMAKRGMRQV